MPTLDQRVKFARRFVRNKEGARWSLKGREWVRSQYWLPSEGYKLWVPEHGDVCDDCKRRANSLIELPFANPTRSPEHEERSGGCRGLDVFPVFITLLNLIRQDGKTFNGMALDMADMALGNRISIALMAASEDQVKALIDENYRQAIEGDEELDDLFEVKGLRVICKETGSFLEGLPASKKSATGRTRRRIRIDEARDVPSEVAWSIMPAIQALSGLECPNGHVSVIDKNAAMAALNSPPKICTVCRARLVPFFGRIVATSSSGVTDNDDDFWFQEIVQKREREPSRFTHVFRSPEPLNPAKSELVSTALQEEFGELSSMRDYVHADLTNEWVRKGEDFVTKAEVESCVDKSLAPFDECSAPAVGFLDTSITTDKTSLVILADDSDGSEQAWTRVVTARMDVWDPAQSGGLIDDRVVQAHVEKLLPLFTALRVLHVDTRGMPWAIRMVKALKHPRVKGWDKSTAHESIAGWAELQKRIRAQTIRFLDSDHMRKEFRGLQVKFTDGSSKVVDRDRRRSHKDVTEALACACYLVAMEAVRKGPSMADRFGGGGARSNAGARAHVRRDGGQRSSIAGRLGPDAW